MAETVARTTVALPLLRRAWLRELGVEHVWATPGGAVAGGPLATRAATEPAIRPGPGPRTVPDTVPDTDAAAGAQAARGETPPAAAEVRAAQAQAVEARTRQAQASEIQAPAAARPRRPATRWLAWQADAPGQGAWMVLAGAEDAGAPEAQRFLLEMMRAAGREAAPVASGQRAGDAPPVAVITVGAAARAALGCGDLAWMEVGEGRLRGMPVRVLALPPLADVTAAAECKAPAWRGLLRLSLG